MKYNYKDVGIRFRNERKKLFSSQENFAAEMRDGKEGDETEKEKIIREPCRISRNTLSALENGDIPEGLTLKQFLTMCEILRCDAAYLLGECKEHIYDCKYICDTTGLSEKTIISLCGEKTVGDCEIANFIDWLVSHSEFIHLIKVIDKANEFSENPKKVFADIGDTVEEMDMFSIYKTHINDMFWKIIKGYHINGIRIEGESNAK